MHSSVLDELIISFNKVKECSNDANLKAYESNFIAANQAIQDLETQIQFVRLKMYLYQREFSKAHAIARSLKKTPSNIKKSIPVIQSLIEEEKYFDVIEICNIFQPIRLDQDSVTTEEEYNQFVELRQKAIDKLKEYNRFDITRLPYEIRIFILKQLDFIDIVNCINVSKDWRRCICNDSANNKYHVILDSKTRQQSGSFSSNFFKTSMKLLCDSVKNLKLDRRLLGEDTRMEIRDLLKSVRFNNLRVLKIGKLKIFFFFFFFLLLLFFFTVYIKSNI
ncbi:hypothetical protein BDC45DRAFT_26199 [Circinella umbellata]|nr:hypothetical protein BDC45DRAFT_26199 [Circinella umbellata]